VEINNLQYLHAAGLVPDLKERYKQFATHLKLSRQFYKSLLAYAEWFYVNNKMGAV
jgi:hypothetical protein